MKTDDIKAKEPHNKFKMKTGLSLEFILNTARAYVQKEHADYMARRATMGANYQPNRRLDTPWLALGELSHDSGAVNWYDGWSDDPASGPVVAANWNHVRCSADAALTGPCQFGRQDVPGGDVMDRLFDILERAGYDCQWSDEVTSCNSCYRAIRTEPDHHECKPKYVVGDGEIVCTTCMEDDGMWEDELAATAHAQGTVSCAGVDPSEYGYVAVRVCQFGWGHKEENLRRDLRDHDYFLQVVDRRQFGVGTLVWVHGDNVESLPEEIEGDADDRLYT